MPLEAHASHVRAERGYVRYAEERAQMHATISEALPRLDPDEHEQIDDEHDREGRAAVLRARLASQRVAPRALSVPCEEHHAPVGAYCLPGPARGICGPRLRLAFVSRERGGARA